SVNGKSGKVTVQTFDNREMEFSVNSMAALTLKSTSAKLSDLKPGDQVIVTAEGKKAVSISLSTTDLYGNTGRSPYRSQNARYGSTADLNEADPTGVDPNEAMKNKGVNPYGPSSVGGASAATLPPSSSAAAAQTQPQDIRFPSAPPPSSTTI